MTQIFVIVWKSGYLSSVKDKQTNLTKALTCGKTILTMLSNLQRVNFLVIKLLPFNHDIYKSPTEEIFILANKKILRNSCLLHYDMNLSLRSQKIFCSQSHERLLFNCCSLLLFCFGCPTMLDTGAVGPTLYVLFLDGYVCIEVLCTLVILAVVKTCD